MLLRFLYGFCAEYIRVPNDDGFVDEIFDAQIVEHSVLFGAPVTFDRAFHRFDDSVTFYQLPDARSP